MAERIISGKYVLTGGKQSIVIILKPIWPYLKFICGMFPRKQVKTELWLHTELVPEEKQLLIGITKTKNYRVERYQLTRFRLHHL